MLKNQYLHHISLLALLLALLMTLTSCGPAREEPGILPEAVELHQTEPAESDTGTETEENGPETGMFTIGYYVNKGLNPYTCNNTVNQALIGLLYEPLFSITPDFAAESCLALSCEKSGEELWTLKLRKGVRFWNGEELRAEDVLYSLEQAKGASSLYAAGLAPMEEVEVTGDDSLTFRWSENRGDLSLLLEIPVVQEGTAGEAVPMGTGPYLPVLGEEGLSQLTANGSWWQQKALPTDKIALYAAEASDLLIYGFERGEITLVAGDLTDPDSLGYSGQYETWDYPTSHLIYLGCNTASGPCRDRDLRQALQAALDRETIVQRLLSGHGIAAPLTFLPDTACCDGQLAALYAEPDTEGLTQWAGEKLTLAVNADSSFKVTIAQFIAANLNEAGLSVQIEELSWTAYEEAVKAGEYDLYLGEVKLSADFDVTALVGQNGSLNFSHFKNQTVEQALTVYRQADHEQRPGAAGALSRVLVQEAPIIPICFEEHSVLIGWGKVEALSATQSDLFYGFEDWVLGE